MSEKTRKEALEMIGYCVPSALVNACSVKVLLELKELRKDKQKLLFAVFKGLIGEIPVLHSPLGYLIVTRDFGKEGEALFFTSLPAAMKVYEK